MIDNISIENEHVDVLGGLAPVVVGRTTVQVTMMFRDASAVLSMAIHEATMMDEAEGLRHIVNALAPHEPAPAPQPTVILRRTGRRDLDIT